MLTGGLSDDGGDDRPRTYRGVLGAFPYAARASDSWLFRSYVVIGGIAAAIVTIVFVLGLIVLISRTAFPQAGTITLSRAFYVVVLLAVVLPITAPILLVARRGRLGTSTRAYDTAMGVAGFAVVISVYLAVLISAPPGQRDPPPSILEPLIDPLYALPPSAGVFPPILAAVLVVLVHLRLR